MQTNAIRLCWKIFEWNESRMIELFYSSRKSFHKTLAIRKIKSVEKLVSIAYASNAK